MSDWRDPNRLEVTDESARERGRAWVAYLKGVLAETKKPPAEQPKDADA